MSHISPCARTARETQEHPCPNGLWHNRLIRAFLQQSASITVDFIARLSTMKWTTAVLKRSQVFCSGKWTQLVIKKKKKIGTCKMSCPNAHYCVSSCVSNWGFITDQWQHLTWKQKGLPYHLLGKCTWTQPALYLQKIRYSIVSFSA